MWVTCEEAIMVEMTIPAADTRYDLIALNQLADGLHATPPLVLLHSLLKSKGSAW